MKNIIIIFIFSLFAKVIFCQSNIDHSKQSVIILNELNKKEFNKVTPLFDSTITSKLDTAKLRFVWNGLLAQIGAFKKSEAPTVSKQDKIEYVDQVCEFEKTSLVFRLGFDVKNKICSFIFVPPTPKSNYKFPAYANKEKYEEKDIVVKTGPGSASSGQGFELPGTLTIPKGLKKFPIVILIHGSGPNGRDERIGSIKMFKDIACGLASNGVGVIRYDKRTKVYGAKCCENPDSITVKEEVTDDVASAVKLARTIEGVDTTQLFLIGHSLGAMLMPRMATEIKGLAGVIMMAGNARPLEDVYMEQILYIENLDENFSEEDRTKLEQVKLQVMRVKKLGIGAMPPASDLPLNINAKYWYDLKKYKQVEVAKKLKLPILILQGERDYQVTMADFNLWKQALGNNKNVRFTSFSKLNHAFTEGDGSKATPSEYELQANIPEYVIADILSFVKK